MCEQGGMNHYGGTVYYIRYTISTSFYFVHYTGSYTGKVAVVAMPLPMRVSTSRDDYYLLYLCILCTTACYLSY